MTSICKRLAASALLATAASLALAADAAPARPNIVFLFSDDHAERAISAYGHDPLMQTPNIDRIANEGAIFLRSYCANSLCGPSRACVLTGLHSHVNGFIDNRSRFDGSQQTFPKLLQQAGYQTAIRGKWHLESDPTGFDSWIVLPGQGQYINPFYLIPDGKVQIKGYSADLTGDMAVKFIEKERDLAKPFFLAVHFKAPHRPFLPPVRYLSTFDNVHFPEPPTLLDNYAGRPTPLPENKMSVAKDMTLVSDLKCWEEDKPAEWEKWFNADDAELLAKYRQHYAARKADLAARNPQGNDLVRWKYQMFLRDYMGTVKAVDDNVGRVLETLDKQGLSGNTLVVYASDQSFYLGEHGWFDKRWMYEESFTMPLVMRWPGQIKPGTRVEALVQNIDYAPTFCEVAGATPPKPMQGASLMPLMHGRTPTDWRKSLYYAYYEFPGPHHVAPHEGVATDQYKLIHYPQTNEWELLDRKADPLELKNLWDEAAYREIRPQMQAELQRLRKLYAVPDDYPKAIPMR
jgi:arylsulfatase A-like enzyme